LVFNNAIFDESFAAFRDLLLLLFCLYKLARVADRDGPGEAMRMLNVFRASPFGCP
jgi:hypothetical protein